MENGRSEKEGYLGGRNPKDQNGNTPLSLAKEKGFLDTHQVIFKAIKQTNKFKAPSPPVVLLD